MDLSICRPNALLTRILLAILGLCSVGLFIAGGAIYRNSTEALEQVRYARREIADLQHLPLTNQALSRLRKVASSSGRVEAVYPAVAYQLLHGRWNEVLKTFDGLMSARHNRYLAKDLGPSLEEVRTGLMNLQGACSSVLDGEGKDLRPGFWKIYNLRGCVSVMLAYLVLEFDEDGRKSGTFLGEAVDDLKAAIERVDSGSASAFERALPRWNLGLVVGAGKSLSLGQEIMETNMEEIRDQLEPAMPQFGGFSPGAPLETKVKK